MLSFSEMCSLVAVRQEMDSWMKQRMLVEPSQVEQLTLPRACTQACSCEGCSLFRRSIFQTCKLCIFEDVQNGWVGLVIKDIQNCLSQSVKIFVKSVKSMKL